MNVRAQVKNYLDRRLDKTLLPVDLIRAFLVYTHEVSEAEKIDATLLDRKKEHPKFWCAPSSDAVFFVLGGGPSINFLQTLEWSHIGDNTSLGINNWMVHAFEPTYLMIEPIRPNDHNLSIIEWQYKSIVAYAKTTKCSFLIKDFGSYGSKSLDFLSRKYPERSFVIPKFSIAGRTLGTQRFVGRFLSKWGFDKSFFLFSRVSVTLAISFAISLGYKKIVLCGVDLNDASYFFEDNSFQSRSGIDLPPGSGQTNASVHSTMDKNVRKLTAEDAIKVFYDEILKKNEIDLYVGSDTSLLSRWLPLYSWPRV